MRYLLIVLVVLAGTMLDAEAARRKWVYYHTIEAGIWLMNAKTEILDCKYGESDAGAGPGNCYNITGYMPVADFFYIKWRDKATGKVYEERVDLKRRILSRRKMDGATIHWLLEDNQLYVHLIPDEGSLDGPPRNRRPSGKPPNGPFKYIELDVKTLYPDNAPPKVHGATPRKLATTKAWRAEVAAQEADREARRREATERGECLLIDRLAFGDKCLEINQQKYQQNNQKRTTP